MLSDSKKLIGISPATRPSRFMTAVWCPSDLSKRNLTWILGFHMYSHVTCGTFKEWSLLFEVLLWWMDTPIYTNVTALEVSNWHTSEKSPSCCLIYIRLTLLIVGQIFKKKKKKHLYFWFYRAFYQLLVLFYNPQLFWFGLLSLLSSAATNSFFSKEARKPHHTV